MSGPNITEGAESALRDKSLYQVAVRLGLAVEKPDLTIPMIHKAMERFYEEYGRHPTKRDGDASQYFRFPDTWNCINGALERGSRGLPGASSLPREAVLLGMRCPQYEIQEIQKAIITFYDTYGRCPHKRDKNPPKHLNPPTSWRALESALKGGYRGLPGGSSLHKEALKLGLKEEETERTLMEVRKAILAFHREQGRPPRQLDRDASRYFGSPALWGSVDSALCFGHRGLPGGSSLYKEAEKMGLITTKPDLTIPMIHKAITKFHAEQGRHPNKRDGDASSYFMFPETWQCVDAALIKKGSRGLPGESTLAKESKRLGLVRPNLTIFAVRTAIKSFYEKHKRLPRRSEGEALSYIGIPMTWSQVYSALREGMRGLPGESSFVKEAKEMGLK